MRSEEQGASHPIEQKSLAGDPGRDREYKGTRVLPGVLRGVDREAQA